MYKRRASDTASANDDSDSSSETWEFEQVGSPEDVVLIRMLVELKRGRWEAARDVGDHRQLQQPSRWEQQYAATSSGDDFEDEDEEWASDSKALHHTGGKPAFASTRAYVWRAPNRRALNKQQPQDDSRDGAAAWCGSDHASTAGQTSSNHNAMPSDQGEEDDKSDEKTREKEWAALTTWLRMNLHHPRTLKRQVLFVGQQNPFSRKWEFDLNPALTWDDVSPETKLRLKSLPQEAQAAFINKYPNRTPSEWMNKVQKYKPAGSSHTANVPLADMIYSLAAIYDKHELQKPAAPGAPVLPPAMALCCNYSNVALMSMMLDCSQVGVM